MPTRSPPVSFAFQGSQGRRVTASFNGGTITSHAGALLLREVGRDGSLFDRVADCFTDHRDPARIEHAVSTLVAQRIVALALGYEDLNDHDQPRHDPVPGLFADKTGCTRKGCAALAGKSTLNRLEHAPEGEPGRYHRIDHNSRALQNLLTDLFIESKTGPPPHASSSTSGVRDPVVATRLSLKHLARRVLDLAEEIAELDRVIAPLVRELAPGLLKLEGVGIANAGELLVAAGENPERLRSEASLAMLCGACPVPASSGKTRRHRLNRGGNRQANSVLHMVLVCRMRTDPRTRAYVARRTREGLSKHEVMRCLQRYVAREVYRVLTSPAPA